MNLFQKLFFYLDTSQTHVSIGALIYTSIVIKISLIFFLWLTSFLLSEVHHSAQEVIELNGTKVKLIHYYFLIEENYAIFNKFKEHNNKHFMDIGTTPTVRTV